MPDGNVSTTVTVVNSTSPLLVSEIVNVTSVPGGPLEGIAVFVTSTPGAYCTSAPLI